MKNDFSASSAGSGGDSGGIFCTSGGQGRFACEPWKAEPLATAAATTRAATRRVTCYFLTL